MPKITDTKKKELNEILKDTAIVDPTDWINDYERGIPVHEKIEFIKSLWSNVMKIDNDTDWIERLIKEEGIRGYSPFMRQYPELTDALQACTDKGIEPNEINTIVREAQFAMLYHFVSILDQSTKMGIFSTNEEDPTLPDKDFGYLQDDLEALNPEYDQEFDW